MNDASISERLIMDCGMVIPSCADDPVGVAVVGIEEGADVVVGSAVVGLWVGEVVKGVGGGVCGGYEGWEGEVCGGYEVCDRRDVGRL